MAAQGIPVTITNLGTPVTAGPMGAPVTLVGGAVVPVANDQVITMTVDGVEKDVTFTVMDGEITAITTA